MDSKEQATVLWSTNKEQPHFPIQIDGCGGVLAEKILQTSDFHSSTLHKWLSNSPTQSYTTENNTIIWVIDI